MFSWRPLELPAPVLLKRRHHGHFGQYGGSTRLLQVTQITFSWTVHACSSASCNLTTMQSSPCSSARKVGEFNGWVAPTKSSRRTQLGMERLIMCKSQGVLLPWCEHQRGVTKTNACAAETLSQTDMQPRTQFAAAGGSRARSPKRWCSCTVRACISASRYLTTVDSVECSSTPTSFLTSSTGVRNDYIPVPRIRRITLL